MARSKPKKLSIKQQVFADTYLANGFKRDEAARAAGYSEKRLARTASDLMKNPLMTAYIDERMKHLQMTADEALYRLGQHARGDISQLLGLSPDELKTHPQAWLVKRVKIGLSWPEKGNGTPKAFIEALELHDQQSALMAIIKQQQLASGKPTEITESPQLARLAELLEASGKNLESVIGRMVEKLEAEAGGR